MNNIHSRLQRSWKTKAGHQGACHGFEDASSGEGGIIVANAIRYQANGEEVSYRLPERGVHLRKGVQVHG